MMAEITAWASLIIAISPSSSVAHRMPLRMALASASAGEQVLSGWARQASIAKLGLIRTAPIAALPSLKVSSTIKSFPCWRVRGVEGPDSIKHIGQPRPGKKKEGRTEGQGRGMRQRWDPPLQQ